ncbi:chloride channel protein [Chromobacterium violaceum]|uniref:chloride channel protein n=1 Tax=Chromobacterium violaceum TaxID=536 RepID=UPI0002D82401|nr:chloride channel protein [Chromobacterium violaceum]SUX40362.1 Voltage-gated ClC-type chloride channel ClcB [Chromobacterium violaceum]
MKPWWRRHTLVLNLPLAAGCGALGALLVLGFQFALHAIEQGLSGRSGSLVAIARQLAPWQRALAPVLGGLLAGLILQQGRHLLRGAAEGDYLEAVRVGDGRLSLRRTLVNSLSSLATVASGGSIGREGAMVALAALGGSLLARLASLGLPRRRLLVACGIAAGWAAAYHAPLAAVAFVCEVVWRRLDWRALPALLLAALTASLTVDRLFGLAPLYQPAPLAAPDHLALAGYCLLALLLGVASPLFMGAMELGRRAMGRLPLRLPWRMALGGAVVGGLAWFWPQMWGNGYSTVSWLLVSDPAWQLVLTLLACKLVATSATSGSGAVGGIFTPMLFAGAAGGALAGQVLNMLLPGWLPAGGAALVGMAAFLAATARAPVLAVLMLMELTGAYAMLPPVALAAWLAAHIGRRLGGRALYQDEAELRRPAPGRCWFRR